MLFPTEQFKEALQTLGLKKNFFSMTFQSFLSESWMDTHGIVGEFSLLLSRCHQMDLTSGCHTVPCHCAYAQNLLTAKLQTQTQGQKHSCLVPFAGLSNCLPPLAPVTGIPRVAKAKKGQAQLTEGAWISDCSQSQTRHRLTIARENLRPHPAAMLLWPKSILVHS